MVCTDLSVLKILRVWLDFFCFCLMMTFLLQQKKKEVCVCIYLSSLHNLDSESTKFKMPFTLFLLVCFLPQILLCLVGFTESQNVFDVGSGSLMQIKRSCWITEFVGSCIVSSCGFSLLKKEWGVHSSLVQSSFWFQVLLPGYILINELYLYL